jgi:hypothetical protein
MSAIVQFTMELTGPFEGKSVTLNHLRFKNGKATVRGDATEIAGIIRYFKRSYNINVAGEEGYGSSQVHSTSQDRETDQVQSGIQPNGTESQEESSVQLRGDDAADGGNTRSLSDRDRHQDSRIPKEGQFQQSANKQVDPAKLLLVMKNLDPKNEAHWNQAGLPKLAVVSEMYGSEGLTRKDLDSVWSGFSRTNTK